MVVWEEAAIPARLMTNSNACQIGLSYGQFGRLQHIWFGCAYADANAACQKDIKNPSHETVYFYCTRTFPCIRQRVPCVTAPKYYIADMQNLSKAPQSFARIISPRVRSSCLRTSLGVFSLLRFSS